MEGVGDLDGRLFCRVAPEYLYVIALLIDIFHECQAPPAIFPGSRPPLCPTDCVFHISVEATCDVHDL